MGFKFLSVAVASVLAFNAHADTTDWGTHGALELGTHLASPGAIDDTFVFTLNSGSNVVSSAVSLASPGALNITGGTVSLFRENGEVDSLLGSYQFDGTTGSTFHAFNSIGAGNYYYQVTGQATGSFGGYYSLSSNAAAVPEPTSMALALAGLVAAGGLYRRRHQQQG